MKVHAETCHKVCEDRTCDCGTEGQVPKMHLIFQPGDEVMTKKNHLMTVVGVRLHTWGTNDFDIECREEYSDGSVKDRWYRQEALTLFKREGSVVTRG